MSTEGASKHMGRGAWTMCVDLRWEEIPRLIRRTSRWGGSSDWGAKGEPIKKLKKKTVGLRGVGHVGACHHL